MLHPLHHQSATGSRLRSLVVLVGRRRRALAVAALVLVLTAIAGALVLIWPRHSFAKYAFTDTKQPKALNRLEQTPIPLTATDKGAAVSLSDNTKVNYTPGGGNRTFMSVSHGESQLQLGLLNAKEVPAQISDNVVTYPDIVPGASLKYTHFKDYVKEDIIVNSKESANSLGFFIPKKEGVTLKRDKVRGIVASHDGAELFYFHPPVAKDKDGKQITFEYALNEHGDDYRLYLVPGNASELAGASYPLTIDPTISWTFENPAPYYLSDPTKIEVADGVLRLVNNGGNYATDNPFAVTSTPVSYSELTGFTEALGAANQGAVRYQLSRTGNAWYYWNGSAWAGANATDYNQANDAATVNAQIGTFASQFGAGGVYIKAFLHANSDTAPAELQSFTVNYTAISSAPTISSLNPSSGSYQGGTPITVTGTNLSASWPYQKKITIDETKIPGTQALQDYPLLISRTDSELRAASSGGRVAKDNGGDIRFTLPNGVKLDHEIERYSPTTGELIAWVRIPYLSATTNTEILMQYGNASVGNQWNTAGAWGPNYKAVYHLADANPNDTFVALDTSKWGTFGTVALSSGRVQLNVNNAAQWSSSGLASMANGPQFNGDFDVSFDFDVSAWSTTIPSDAHEISFQLFNTNADGTAQSGNAYYTVYQKAANGSRSFNTWQDETNASFGNKAAAATTTSKLRFTRTGNTITAYGYDANAWVAIGSFTSTNAGKRMAFNIYASNRTSGTTVPAAYLDNFTVALGAPIKDSTGNSNLAWNAGTNAAPATGKIGNGYYLNGTATSYIQLPNSPSLENIQEDAYSVQSWYNPASTPAAGADDAHAVVMKDGYHGGIRYNAGNTFTMDHWLADTTPASAAATSAGAYTTSTMHMAVGTVDRTAGQTKMFANGNMTMANFPPNAATYEYGQQPWRIGIARPGASSYRWLARGTVDEVRLMSGALPDNFIAAEYNNHSSPGTFYSVGNEEAGVRLLVGGTPANNIKLVNATTLTATTPTHAIGTYDAQVVSPDGQTATLPSAFTFTSPLSPPEATSITPNTSVASGGTAVTVKGNNFTLPNSWTPSGWANAGSTGQALYNTMVYVVGDRIYRAGGTVSGTNYVNTIYSAPLSNPTSWTNTGKTLPTAMASANVAVIGDYVYAFGGEMSSGVRNFIHRAPVSDPTTWTLVTGKILGSPVANGALSVVGDRVYLFGGYSSTSATTSMIQSAPVSDPTSWSQSGKYLPIEIANGHLFSTADKLYLVGGYRTSPAGGVSTIYTANKSDPTTWTNTGKTLPTTLRSGAAVTIGDYAYILGGIPSTASTPASTIYRASLSDLATWTLQSETMSGYTYSSSTPVVIGDNVYLLGGYTGSGTTSTILRSPITSHPRANNYMNPWQTDWVTTQTDLTNITINGVPLTNLKIVDATTMTGTVGASAAGTYDVVVANYDGQQATLPAAFTYYNPPSISAINPNSAVNTGGDTVTITGTSFRGNMSVTFDGLPGTNLQIVNENTITVTAPAHPSGPVKVTATNEYGSYIYEGFSYRHPAPIASSVSPAFGSTNGGTGVTVSGLNFTPINTGGSTWASAGNLSYAVGIQQLAVVGDYIYMYGGYQSGSGTNVIYRAAVSNPTVWTYTGKTLPGALSHSQVAVIGDYVYLFGGLRSGAGVSVIYRAPITDPSAMVDTGKTLPAGLAASQLAVVGTDLYLIGGYTTAPVNVIYKSTLADPLTWTNTGKTLPAVNSHSQLAILGDKMYLFGGYGTGSTAVNTIFTANTSDPTAWSVVSGRTLPSVWAWSSLAIVGNDMYLINGYNNSAYSNAIYKASVSDPTIWTSAGTTPSAGTFGAVALIGDYVYLFGGYQAAAQSFLQRAPIQRNRHTNQYMKPWQTSWPTAPDQTRVTIGGVPLTDVTIPNSTTITGRTGASPSGTYDVVVRNYDGQEATLSGAFEYAAPPTITTVSPSEASASGGDTVTITGTEFKGTMAVSFGGVPSSNVTVVNDTTLTAVVPPGLPGPAAITASNQYGTSASYTGFRYMSAPAISNITPNRGLAAGGTNITITGTGFMPVTGGGSNWTAVAGKTLPDVRMGASTAVIGDSIYMYGGYTGSAYTNTIYRAPISDPTTWTDTGKTLPINYSYGQIAVINDYVYLFGGYSGAYAYDTIYRAPVSDPTNIRPVSGKKIPSLLYSSHLEMVDGYLYLFGGNNGSAFVNTIYRAPISDPTTWTDTGKTLPAVVGSGQLFKNNDKLYVFAGQNSGGPTNTIFSAPLSDPTTWTNTGVQFSAIRNGQPYVVGDYIYIYGGYTSSHLTFIYRAPLNNPTAWGSAGVSLPNGVSSGSPIWIGDTLYIFGGPTTAIYKATTTGARPNVHNLPWTTNRPTATLTDQTAVLVGGIAATNVQVVNDTTVTATTAAHAPEVVDVAVVNADGTTATRSNAYTYGVLPSVSAVSPATAPASGGDSITITGTDFTDDATVTIGGVPATAVNVINSTTLSVVVPPGREGPAAITVTTPFGKGTPYDGFRYLASAPVITNITPSNGTSLGGTNVTITGTNFSPPNAGGGTGWSTVAGKTLPGAHYDAQVVVVGNTLYYLGGYNGSAASSAIYSASTTNPTTWTNTGKTLPTGLYASQAAVIGDYVYLFGGNTGSAGANVIYRAPVSDPTSWSVVSGKTLPTALQYSQVAVIGDYVYLFGGNNGTGYSNIIYRAPVSDPTTWTNTGKTLPGNIGLGKVFTNSTHVYYVGGYNNSSTTSVIYRAPLSDPTTWTNTGSTLAVSNRQSSAFVYGNSVYLLGGISSSASVNTIYRAPIDNPTTWTSTGSTLPAGLQGSAAVVSNNTMYLLGGYTTAATSAIYAAPLSGSRTNTYAPPWLIDRSTSSLPDQTDVTLGGVPATNVTVVSPTSITATTSARAAGQVDVAVTSYDGQVATLANGFQYMDPPTISAITPSTASSGGGDTVTITGTNFGGTLSLTFGGAPATNVNIVNPTTITATVPAHAPGEVAVAASNEYGAARYEGFRYVSVPPTVTGVSPSSGPSSGGTNITITGTGFLPPNTGGAASWATVAGKTLPAAISQYNSIVLDGYIYIFGGYSQAASAWSNTIYRAPVSDPTTWTNTGKTLPGTVGGTGKSLQRIGNYLYIFDGNQTDNGGYVFRAPVSDPTNWTNTNQRLPGIAVVNATAVIGDYVYAFGGFVAGTTYTGKILRAPVSDPTAWVDTGKTLPGATYLSQFAIVGNDIYSIGGTNGAPINGIWKSTISDPTTWTNTGKTFPATTGYGAQAIIGDYMYILGGIYAGSYTNKIFRAPITDLTTWTDTGSAVPYTGGLGTAMLIGDYVYVFGGYSGSARTNAIYRAPVQHNRQNLYHPAMHSDWGTLAADQTGVTIGGVPATNVQVVNATTITATTGVNTNSGGVKDVAVISDDGSTGTLTSSFTYYNAPSILAVTPSTTTIAGGDTITITGNDFRPGATVSLNGIEATATIVDEHTITFVMPPFAVGIVDLTITNTDGQSATAGAAITVLSIIDRLGFATAPSTLRPGGIAKVIVQAQDYMGRPLPAEADTSIQLEALAGSSASATGSFSLDRTTWVPITQVTLPAGQHSAELYYKETSTGIFTLKASETPSGGWSDATKTVTVSADAPHTWPFDEAAEHTYDQNKIEINGGMARLKDTTTFTRGTGADGAAAITGTKNINTDLIATGRTCADGVSYSVTALTATTATLAAAPAADCLKENDEILLVHQQGTSSAYANAGNYEFLRVASVSDTTITFKTSKQKNYGNTTGSDAGIGTTSASQRVMIQRVPNYTTINIPAGATLTADAWNGTKGGILAFRTYATTTINGTVTMAGKGYRGGLGNIVPGEGQFGPGAYAGESYAGTGYQTPSAGGANRSGGGTGQSSTTWNVGQNGGGGGGGGYGANGSNGATSPSGHAGGGGGATVNDSFLAAKLYLGGGGGGGGQAVWGAGGDGAAGGGSIIISGATVNVGGTVSANGNTGGIANNNSSHEGGGGGGGAGGAILVTGQTVNFGDNKVTSTGGAGGNKVYSGGDGGTGAVGRITLHTTYQSPTGTTTPSYAHKGYATDDPFITPIASTSVSYTRLTSFSEARGAAASQGAIRYQLSPDKGTSWYWHNGMSWVQAAGASYNQAASAAVIGSNIASFDDEVGEGDLLIRAFLHADTPANPVELDGVSVGYDQTPQNPASLTSISPTQGPVDGGNTITANGSGFVSEFHREATLTNEGSEKTDTVETITLDTAQLISAGKMRTDCRDLRIFAADGTTPLPFALVSGCNTATTMIAVRFTNLPSGATTIVLDYGNPRKPSASNIAAVFPVLGSSALNVWLRADDGNITADGTTVQTWYDQSGKGNNFVQNTAARRPTFKANVLNGRPILRFDGTDDQIGQATGSPMANNFTALTVARATSSHEVDTEATSGTAGISNQRYLWSPQQYLSGSSGAGISLGTNGVSVYEHAETYLPPLAVYNGAVNGFNLVSVQYNNRQPSIYVNNQLRRTGLASPKTTVNWSTNLGCGDYGCWPGDVAEYIAFDTALTNSDRQQAETYLNAKYNLYSAALPVTLGEERNLMTISFGGVPGTVTSADADSAEVTVPHGTQLGKVDVTLNSVDGSTATLTQAYRYFASKYGVVSAPTALKELEPATVVIAAQDMQGNSYVMDQDTLLGLRSSASTGFFARDLTEDIQTRWDYNNVLFATGANTATFYYRDNAKGAPTITVSPPAPETTAPAVWQPNITSRYRLLVTGVSDPVKSGIPSSITIQAVDYNGEPLNDYKGRVHFTSNDASATLPEDSDITEEMLGGRTFVNGVMMVTEGDWCVSVTDTADPDITGGQCGVSVSPPNDGTIAKLAFITPPQNFQATSQSGVMTVQAQDATGAPVPVTQNTTLYLYSDSATGQFSTDGTTGWTNSPLAVTVRAGTTAASFYYKDTALGAHKLTARDDEGTGADFGWINATQTVGVGVGGAYRVKITAPAGPFTAGQASPAFRATLQDELGNEVPVFSQQRIWITGSSGTDELSPDTDFDAHAVTRLPLMIQPGEASAEFYYRDEFAGNRTITASDSDPPNGDTGLMDDQAAITVGGGAPAQIAFATAPFELVAGATSGVVTVELRDALGNRAAAQGDTTVYLYAQAAGALFRDAADTTDVTSVVIPSGQSSAGFKFKQTSFRATQTITVSDNNSAPDGAAGLDDASQTEAITAGTPSKLVITSAAPASTTAGTTIGPVSAALQNQYNVTIPATSDTTLYLRSNSAGGSFALDASGPWSSTLSPPLSAGNGNLDFYYKDTRAGTATITVADQSGGTDTGLTDATQNMTFTAGAAARLNITSAPQSLQAGQASAVMTVRLEDQYGNQVNSDANLDINITTDAATGRFDTSAGGAFSNNATTRTINSGQSSATFYYKDFAAGTPAVTASANGLTSGIQTQTITWGSPTRIDITGPNTATAGQVAGPFTAHMYNAYNVNVPAVGTTTVNLSSNNGTGRFDTISGGGFDGSITSTTIPSGGFDGTFYYKGTSAATHIITGASGGMTDTLNVAIGAATADHLRITSSPQTLQLGQISAAITIRAEDMYGNATNVAAPVALALSTTSANGQFYNSAGGGSSMTATTIPANNNAVSVYYSDTEVGTPTLTFASSYSPLTQTETIVTGTPTKLYFWADNNSLTAGAPKQVYVFTANAYGVVIPAQGDTPVNLTTNSPGSGRFDTNAAGSFTNSSLAVTIPNGSTNTSFYYRDTSAGSVRITGARGGFTSATYDFNVAAGAPNRIAFTNSPRTTVAGDTSDHLTVTLYDAYGNIAPTSSAINITVTDSESTAQLSANGSSGWATGGMIRTLPAGQSSASFYYKDTVAGTKTISANAPELTGATQNTTVNPDNFHHFGFTTSPQTIVVQNPSGPVTISGYDVYGNQRTMPAAVLRLTSGSPQGTFSMNSSSWSNITNLNIVNGTYTSTFYYKDARLANTTITATPTSSYSAISQPVTILAGNVSSVRFTSDPQTVVTSTPSKPIDVRLTDNNGYPSAAGNEVTVTINSDSGTGQFSLNGADGWESTLTLTYQPGETLKQMYFRDSAEGTVTMGGSAAGLTSGSQPITVIPGVISQLGIVADASVTAGTALPVIIQTLTADGLGAAVAGNTTVQLSASNGGQFSLSDTNWQPISSVTIAAGQYQRSLFYRNTAAGNDNVTAKGPAGSNWTDGTDSIAVGAGTYVKLAFLTLPQSVNAGAPSSPIVVQARDQYGNATLPAADQQLYIYGPAEGQFATDAAGPWDATSVLMPAGTGTATFYYNDSLPGSKTLRVSDRTPLDTPDQGIQNAVGQIAVASLPPTQLRFTSDERTVVAGERSEAITIEAAQANGERAIVGSALTIRLNTNRAGGQFFTGSTGGSPVTQVTLPVGGSQITVYYRSETANVHQMTASANGLASGTQNISVTAAAATKLVAVSPAQNKTAGDESDQITVQLQDQFGNPARNDQDTEITLSSTSATGQFSAAPAASWSNASSLVLPAQTSDLTLFYRDTASGTHTLSFTAPGLTQATQDFTVAAGAAAKLRFVTLAQSLVAGQISNITSVVLSDSFGNAVVSSADLTVHLSSTSAQASFSQSADFAATTQSVTIPAGASAASFYFKDRTTGTPTIAATDLPLPDSPDLGLTNATQQAVITAGAPDHLAWTASATGVAGRATELTVELQNVYNIPVAAAGNTAIYLSSESGSGIFASGSDMSNPLTQVVLPAGNSSVTVFYRDTAAGAINLAARDTQSADGGDVGITDATYQLTILPEAAARLRYISSAQNLEAGEPSSVMAVQIQDIYGNAVTVSTGANLYVATSSPGGAFADNDSFAQTISSVQIPAGSSIANFYYRDTAVGSATITIGDNALPETPDLGLANATQTVNVSAGSIAKLGWADVPAALEAGEVSAPLRIQAQNRFGVATPVVQNTTIYLDHSASGSGFSTSTSGPWTTTQVTIPAGQKETAIYYRNQAAASDTITAADNNPAIPDTGWTNGTADINVAAGEPVSLVFTTPPREIIARHTSPAYTIETRNRFGAPAPVTNDLNVYVRSTVPAPSAEFATNANGPWGINYVTIPAGQSSASFYYHDLVIGTPTLTASDNLPVSPDTGLTNATQDATITKQTIHHFLVTNISTPQVQGTPTSAVVVAQDADNYIIDNYEGTITFSASDSDAVLPQPYTFVPGDESIHTFTNGVAFLHEGVKSVTVTDQNGITGTQTDIVVSANTAGPISGLRFTGVTPPLVTNADTAAGPLTIQAVDSNGQPSNAPEGGYKVRLSSSSTGGQYALSPDGPWNSKVVATIPAHLSSVNVYYRDSEIGSHTLTASDWQGDADDPGISNATLNAQVRALQIDVDTQLEVNNNSHYYAPSKILYSKNSNGQYYARSDFVTTIKDKSTGVARTANLTYTWRSLEGAVLATQTVANTSSYTYHLEPIQGTVTSDGDYTLEITAEDPASGVTGRTIIPVHLSGWVVRLDYDAENKVLGQPLPYTIRTYYNGAPQDPVNMLTINFRDDNGEDVAGSQYKQTLGQLTRTGVGFYSGTMPTTGLKASAQDFGNAYYLYARLFDSDTEQNYAEDNHYDIFFQNNPAVAPKNFQIEKVQTSTPPAAETYDLKFKWDASQGATKYVVYRSQNKFAGLFSDPCTIDQVKFGHRFGDAGATTPFCETAGQHVVGTDDTTQWAEMASVDAPSTSVTIPWARLQSDLPGSTYFYLVRAENAAGQMGYSTMAVSTKKHFVTNAAPQSSINWVSLPYNASIFTNAAGSGKLLKASDVVKEIEGSMTGSAGNDRNKKISRVALWDSSNQSSQSFLTYSTPLHRWTGNDFTINPGDGVYLQPTQASGFDWTVVGNDVVNSLTLRSNTPPQTNLNWISVPYSSKYQKASDIVKDFEGAMNGASGNDRNRYISRIARWDNTSQASVEFMTYSTPLHRWLGNDFTINPGDGVYIQLSGGQLPFQWVPPLIINPYN